MYEQNENPWNDPQDSQSQQEMYHRNPEPGNASNGLAVAALICSVLSIVSVCCLYGAFVFGGLAIIFALLSRGARKKTYGAARTALLMGTAGVLISVAQYSGPPVPVLEHQTTQRTRSKAKISCTICICFCDSIYAVPCFPSHTMPVPPVSRKSQHLCKSTFCFGRCKTIVHRPMCAPPEAASDLLPGTQQSFDCFQQCQKHRYTDRHD